MNQYKTNTSEDSVNEPDLSGTYTAADYLTWKMDELVELIRGKIFKITQAPSSDHQLVSVRLSTILQNHLKNGCQTYPAPFDVFLVFSGQEISEARNIVEPDICVICDSSKIHRRGCVGAPGLIIEIISPSSSKKDQVIKRELYEEYGVQEYWIVNIFSKSIHQYVLKKDKYNPPVIAVEDQLLQSASFPELQIDLSEIFVNLKEYEDQ